MWLTTPPPVAGATPQFENGQLAFLEVALLNATGRKTIVP